MIHRRRLDCRGCGGTDLVPVLDLGLQPLANAFPASPDEFNAEPRFPLVVSLCTGCRLLQLADVIAPEVLFGHYLYLTSMSGTMEAHHQEHAARVMKDLDLGSGDLVIDVASNDGSLLLAYQRHGLRTLGIEPAQNVADVARDRGVETVSVFFDASAADRIVEEHGHSKAAFANNVLAHVDDPRGFLVGLSTLVGDQGAVVVEVPYVRHLLDRFEYDTIYHEHLSYFSVTALASLYAAAGLRITRVDEYAVHGGSLRVWARRDLQGEGHAPSVHAVIQDERKRGLDALDRLRAFAGRVADHRVALRRTIAECRSEGRSIAAYGAPAKGSTLLNYCELDASFIDFTVDRNPLKVGRFLPGVHVPILPVEEIVARMPDYLLILPWNLEAEIRAQEAPYVERGGRFVVPIPEPRIVS